MNGIEDLRESGGGNFDSHEWINQVSGLIETFRSGTQAGCLCYVSRLCVSEGSSPWQTQPPTEGKGWSLRLRRLSVSNPSRRGLQVGIRRIFYRLLPLRLLPHSDETLN